MHSLCVGENIEFAWNNSLIEDNTESNYSATETDSSSLRTTVEAQDASSLLNFVDSASDTIRSALLRNAKPRRQVNHRRYLQKQARRCRTDSTATVPLAVLSRARIGGTCNSAGRRPLTMSGTTARMSGEYRRGNKRVDNNSQLSTTTSSYHHHQPCLPCSPPSVPGATTSLVPNYNIGNITNSSWMSNSPSIGSGTESNSPSESSATDSCDPFASETWDSLLTHVCWDNLDNKFSEHGGESVTTAVSDFTDAPYHCPPAVQHGDPFNQHQQPTWIQQHDVNIPNFTSSPQHNWVEIPSEFTSVCNVAINNTNYSNDQQPIQQQQVKEANQNQQSQTIRQLLSQPRMCCLSDGQQQAMLNQDSNRNDIYLRGPDRGEYVQHNPSWVSMNGTAATMPHCPPTDTMYQNVRAVPQQPTEGGYANTMMLCNANDDVANLDQSLYWDQNISANPQELESRLELINSSNQQPWGQPHQHQLLDDFCHQCPTLSSPYPGYCNNPEVVFHGTGSEWQS